MSYEIEELLIEETSDANLEPIVALTNSIGAEREPRYTPLSIDDYRLFTSFPGEIRKRYVAYDEARRPVASAQFSHADDGSNPHLMRVGISVAARHRRRGIATDLLKLATQFAGETERSTMAGFIFSSVPAAAAFVGAIGGKETLEHHMNVLKMSDLDRSQLQRWAEEGPARGPGYTVSLIGGAYPEELLEGMTHLYYVLERDMPTPDGHEPRSFTPEIVSEYLGNFLRAGDVLTAVAIHDQTDSPVGMSQLFRRNTDPDTWQVTTTMVDPDHRGHALGKWVKAAVTLAAMEQWPGGEYQETGNATENDAMLGINNAMGFKPELDGTEVEVDLEAVEAFLDRRSAGNVE